jgi:hypothetical protein
MIVTTFATCAMLLSSFVRRCGDIPAGAVP